MDELPVPNEHPAKNLKETLTHACGWCGRSSWHRRVDAVWAGYDSIATGRGPEYQPRIVSLYQCGGCENANTLVWSTYASDREGWQLLRLEHSWPSARAREMEDLNDEGVQTDRLEAMNCFHQGQYRAATLMARSALQRATRALLARATGALSSADKGTLNSELDRLVERGVITSQLRANADEVRLSGNDVAHPEELGSVTRDDAQDSLTFLDDFVETTMAIPGRQQARKARREGDEPGTTQ